MQGRKQLNLYFLCVHNRCRSQMAEAFARKHAAEWVEVNSAGLATGDIHPSTVKAMNEVGIDWSGAVSKRIDMKIFVNASVVVKLCESMKERCPVVPFGIIQREWNLEDPHRGEAVDEEILRKVRDDIEQRVIALLREYDALAEPSIHNDSAEDHMHFTEAEAVTGRMADTFKLLGDRTRLTLLAMLREREQCVCDMVAQLNMTQPNISQHMRKLKAGGLVTEEKRGQWVHYSLNSALPSYVQSIIDRLPSVPQRNRSGETECG